MKNKSKILPNNNTIAKTATAKGKDESQKKLNVALAAYDKRLRMLQTQFDSHKKAINAINIQNKQILKTIGRIASSTKPNITALNQGLKAMKKINPPSEIISAISKMNSNLISQVNDSLNNVDFSSQIEKVFRRYEPSEPFIKAVEDMNPSDQIDNMIEQFRQDWKYQLDKAISTFREVTEKRTEQSNSLKNRVQVEDEEEEKEVQINEIEEANKVEDEKEVEAEHKDKNEHEDEDEKENEQTY